MNTIDRHQRIIALVEDGGDVAVSELAARVAASEATVRRDLADLDARGLVRRYHGGARRAELRGRVEPFVARLSSNLAGKQRIARAVAQLLAPGEAVVIDSGTTGLEVAKAITGKTLRVVPLSLPALAAVATAERIQVTLPGGDLRPGEQSFAGPMTQRALAGLRFDTALIAPCALHVDTGPTAHDVEDAAVKQAAMRSAERRILLCDEAKWGRTAFAAIAELSAFDVLVTDHAVTDAERARLDDAGIELVVA